MYLVSVHTNASVKLRDELADVKHLERVDDDGLELWKPVLKTAFPLSARADHDGVGNVGRRGAVARPHDLHARTVRWRVGRDESGPAGPSGAQTAVALRRRRVHGRANRSRDRVSEHRHDRDRIAGSCARRHDDRTARPGRTPERQRGTRPEDTGRVRRAPKRRHRRRDELRQVLRRGTPARRYDRDRCRSGRGHKARRRARCVGCAVDRGDRADDRGGRRAGTTRRVRRAPTRS